MNLFIHPPYEKLKSTSNTIIKSRNLFIDKLFIKTELLKRKNNFSHIYFFFQFQLQIYKNIQNQDTS